MLQDLSVHGVVQQGTSSKTLLMPTIEVPYAILMISQIHPLRLTRIIYFQVIRMLLNQAILLLQYNIAQYQM